MKNTPYTAPKHNNILTDLIVIWPLLTWWEASTKEHVEQVFRWDVCFKITMVSVPAWVWSLLSILVILPSFLSITQHGVSITNGWKMQRKPTNLHVVRLHLHVLHGTALEITCNLPLNASVAPGAWFLSGWNFRASFLYAFLRSSSEAVFSTPRIW